MKHRRLIIVGVIAVVLLVWSIVASGRSGTGPIPALTNLLRSGQKTSSVTNTVDSIPTESIDLPDSVVGLLNKPLAALQFLPKTSRFLAYGLNDQTIYIIDRKGLGTGLFRHSSSESFNYALLSPDEKNLICATQADGQNKIVILRLSDGYRSEALADLITVNWMPDGRLIYARLQQDRIGVYLTKDATFGSSTEVARLPLAYSDASLVPSPNGQQVAAVSSAGIMDEGIGAQIIYLAQNTISKFGSDVVSATWSPDSKYLFGISGSELVNRDNPTMIAWDVATKKTATYENAHWFPSTLTDLPGHAGVYWTIQASNSELDEEVWAVTVIDGNKQKVNSVNLVPKVSGSIGLLGLTSDSLIGLGSDSAYQTALKPILDAAIKILP